MQKMEQKKMEPNPNLISIAKLEGNSWQGNPLFSRPGLLSNTFHQAFNHPPPAKSPPPPQESKSYEEIRNEFKEYKAKKKFETALLKFETKEKHKT